MNYFLKKIKKLASKQALTLLFAIFVVAGAPNVAHAWTIYISPFSYTPVTTGGNTTISWYATSAQQCTLVGPTLPCTSFGSKGVRGGSLCYQSFSGTTGSVTTGPITGPTSYTLSCYSPPGCSWFCYAGSGSASLTVYPTAPAAATPTTLTSFTATPATISVSGRATLSWAGVKGSSFRACELTGGQWGTGTWFTTLPGTIQTNVLTTTTTYNMNCFDTTGASTGWKSATVTVTPPRGPCNDIPLQTIVPNGCVAPVPAPGICTPTGGSYTASSNTCSCPAGKHLSGSTCVNNPLCANGLADSYAPSCTCPSGKYQPPGSSSCAVLPVCPNGLNSSYSPACTCPSGQVQIRGGATCVLQGAINTLTVNPSRVFKGNKATISWSTANMSTCSLSGLTAAGTTNLATALSSSINPVISSKTVYTLSCIDTAGLGYSSSVTVNLVPQTKEQ